MFNGKDIRKIIQDDLERRKDILEARRYYENKNNIINTGVSQVDNDKDPLRNADNRISHNFHQLLVDEKASYMFTYPVLFDVENNENTNKEIRRVLGDDFESVSKQLCVEASNCAIAWLHYWIDDESNNFEYALVNTEQVIPKYTNKLKKTLSDIYRYYEIYDEVLKETSTVFEHWNDRVLNMYTLKGGIDNAEGKIIDFEEIQHSLETMPFIEFRNNNRKQNDLQKYKNLIDLYDKVISGYANDLEDIQQIIYILENYGGEDLKEFLGDLKRYKAIKTETGDGGGGVKTLQIEIPVEARVKILDIVKKQIYESGQGLQQDTESFGNASGVALKFFYRKLELKSGNLETEFKRGFNLLIRAILRYLKVSGEPSITQTYIRNMISNDLESAQIAQISMGTIPQKLILKNHPWVDDPEVAEKMLKEEQGEKDPYEDINKGNSNE